MDVLASLDLDTKDKKSLRVRSWYMYEQYKSLERNQLDVAQQLKDKSFQDKILRQELSDRRARRKLYDEFGLCQSESSIKSTISNHTAHAPSLSVSNDDFFESFCEEDDERVTRETELENTAVVNLNKSSMEEYKSLDNCNGNASNSGSINSVVENITITDNEDVKDNSGYKEHVQNVNCIVENVNTSVTESTEYYLNDKKNMPVKIAQDINKQLHSVREDIQYLEDITNLELDSSRENLQCFDDIAKLEDESSTDVSECSRDRHYANIIPKKNKQPDDYNGMIPIWSKLVSFAYQIVQLNHGNSYCDYSSQFLTAVLACDILRRCINRMCNILQPYVSPINFVTNNDKSDPSYKFAKTKKSEQSRKYKKIEKKPNRRMNLNINSSRLTHNNHSEYCWKSCLRRTSFENWSKSKSSRRASEPWRHTFQNPIRETSSSSNSTIWSQFSKEYTSKHKTKNCTCCKKAMNPMLRIARYIDSILKDMHDL